MEWWTTISIIITILSAVAVFVLVYLDYRKENREYNEKQKLLEKLNDIFELDDLGICKSCKYGKTNCIKDGCPHCRKEQK